MRLSFAYTTAKQMKRTCGRDSSGGAAVPERSVGMKAKAETTDSPIFGSLRKQTDKKPPGNLKSEQTQNGRKKNDNTKSERKGHSENY